MNEYLLFSFLDPFRGTDAKSVALKMILAVLFGGLIGLERRKKRRPAGFRTHILVCVGASLAVAINLYLYELFPDWSKLDISRLGAQVINGIGFLGAGTILITGRQQVKGLTTAAGLWASACMGLTIGFGYYELAILACVAIYFTITIFNNLEHAVISKTKNMNINVIVETTDDIRKVTDKIKEIGAKIFDVEITNVKEIAKDSPNLVIEMQLPSNRPHSEVIAQIAVVPGVISVDEN